MTLEDFEEIWAVDFEFIANQGRRPEPVCLVAIELRSGRTIRQWQGEFSPSPPYGTGPNSLFVAFYASAELGCHLALGWPMPARVLDLYTEFRNAFNGLYLPSGWGLLGALAMFGQDTMPATKKDAMRDLIVAGGPWDHDQRQAILNYCSRTLKLLAGCCR